MRKYIAVKRIPSVLFYISERTYADTFTANVSALKVGFRCYFFFVMIKPVLTNKLFESIRVKSVDRTNVET